MNNVKMCVRCNAVLISNLNRADADYYRHLSIKYCDACRDIVRKDKNAQAVKRYRQRKKQSDAVRSDNVDLIKQENEQLRKQIDLLSDRYVELVDTLDKLDRLTKETENQTIRWHKKRIVS